MRVRCKKLSRLILFVLLSPLLIGPILFAGAQSTETPLPPNQATLTGRVIHVNMGAEFRHSVEQKNSASLATLKPEENYSQAKWDFNGDLLLDSLALSSLGLLKICSDESGETICRPWAQFSGAENTKPELRIGDFNGDGRSDILHFAPGLGGVTLAYSGPSTAIEREVIGLNLSAAAARELLVADIDSDGVDELVRFHQANSSYDVWKAVPGTSVQGILISIDSSLSVNSDMAGAFRLERVPSGRQKMRATFPSGFVLERMVTVPASGNVIAHIVTDSYDGRSSAHGQALGLHGPVEGPAACTGYLPSALGADAGKWGPILWANCPKGYAILAGELRKTAPTYLIGLAREKSADLPFSGFCCKLPHSDILTETHFSALDECPEESVATGVWNTSNSDPRFSLRCTQINVAKYSLGARLTGVYWGTSIDMLWQSPRVLRDQIPAAIRDGISRLGFSTWASDGCIGRPWGSLLVAKGVNRCSGFGFRELRQRDGAPVKMFPECRAVSDVFDPLTGCDYSVQ